MEMCTYIIAEMKKKYNKAAPNILYNFLLSQEL